MSTLALLLSLLLRIFATQPAPAAVATDAAAMISSSFTACLSDAGVSNVTPRGSPAYDAALRVSVQNLRFAGPTSPKPAAVVVPSSLSDLRAAVLCSRASGLAHVAPWLPDAFYLSAFVGAGLPERQNQTGSIISVEAARVWGERYFLGNYDRLVRAKTLIDPDNVFRNAQSIPPLGRRRPTRVVATKSPRGSTIATKVITSNNGSTSHADS
ncbi:hypothetical protein PR202_gb28748 [Eleusine coracana subsp. coracana]|uniref:Berberine/berberine-like domain-containing protein n=1 Tax=Eleusine coracana subsp. coracana TaxID=191504 RepID=A0AAV5FXL9_ELECO|nr:hypothetical protein PR202_gb28748 [Eleusine coracana subsp. coracana]